MKKGLFLLTLLLGLALLAGCSLTPDSDTGNTAGLRLLQNATNSTTLSSPEYDDWSPQMVSWKGINYLYFLSTRPFYGTMYGAEGWTETADKSAGTAGIFRAEQSTQNPQNFFNLQLYTVLDADNVINIVAVSNTAEIHDNPVVYATEVKEGSTNIFVYSSEDGAGVSVSASVVSGNNNILGGKYTTQNGFEKIFLGNYEEQATNEYEFSYTVGGFTLEGSRVINFTGTVFYAYDRSTENVSITSQENGETTFQFRPESLTGIQLGDKLNLVKQSILNPNAVIQGISPAIFTHPKLEEGRFGFYVSRDGILMMLVYNNYTDYAAYNNGSGQRIGDILQDLSLLDNQQMFPLITVTHYLGTIDQDPHFVPGSGLYFSSDRAGKGIKDLYFVPKDYLTLPDEILNLPFNPSEEPQ